MPSLSVLDLAFVTQGSTPADALRNSLSLAKHVESLGYERFWLAEHHNMIGIASAATSVVIGHIAGGTQTIRVGAGGIMLPNHSPLVIAEQFGTLEALYPGRIDLGLGRAPGTDQRTLQALRRAPGSAENFPYDVLELQALLGPLKPGQLVQAVPGTGSNVPLWMLGSSLFGAQLAALLGLPFGFASHFAPADLSEAIRIYRAEFKPSRQLARPYVMLCINCIAADTDEEGSRLFTSIQQSFVNMLRGTRGQLQPPIDNFESFCTPQERAQMQSMLACSFVGSKETILRDLQEFIRTHEPDELMIASAIYEHEARLKSYEILMGLKDDLDRGKE